MKLTEAPAGIPVLPIARDGSIAAGENVVLLSYPGGLSVTAVRAGVDDATIEQAEKAATNAFVHRAGAEAYVRTWPNDDKQFDAALKANLSMQVFWSALVTARASAQFEALASTGRLQPDVGGAMNVSGVRADAIPYHTLGGVAGSRWRASHRSEARRCRRQLPGVRQADQRQAYQQSDAVPVSYVLRLKPELGAAR
ncbi:MAG: hypothetical protein QM736_09080 [Vicinamibacterales bacterium]